MEVHACRTNMVQNENKSEVKGLKGNDLFIALSKKGKTCTVYC